MATAMGKVVAICGKIFDYLWTLSLHIFSTLALIVESESFVGDLDLVFIQLYFINKKRIIKRK
jgi:hypothetical protein